MKVKVDLPIEVDINYRQAINVLRNKVVDITKCSWHGLSYSDIDHKVYYEHQQLKYLTEEEHEFAGAIIKLIEAQEAYEHPLVL